MTIRSKATLTLRAMLARRYGLTWPEVSASHVGPKIRVWGEPQQAAFVPLVATEALLAI